MRPHFVILPVGFFLSCTLVAAAYGAEPGDWDDPSWQLLREAHIHRDAHSLATYLRDQCGADGDLSRVDSLIRQLGSPDFEVRERAAKGLVAIGPAAVAGLTKAQNDPDAEILLRAKECLSRIGGEWRPELAQAAVRVLIRRGGDDAVPALLRFLPYADCEELQDDVWFGMDALVVRQGKLDPCLTEALRDRLAVRRAAAACIVGRRGDAGQRAAVGKLLTDAEPEVRLRAAQGLLAAKDGAGVPTLTALLEGTPIDVAWQAEELLRYIAGPDAPAAILGRGVAEDRHACRAAWEAWWKEQGPKVDLANLDATSRRPGLILLCDGGLPEEATGRVWLLGCDGVRRWDLRGLSNPADARLVAGGRGLVAERSLEPRVQIPLTLPPEKKSPDEGVSLRSLQGSVVWRYRGVDEPTQCEAMPDGRVLIAGRKLQIAELDLAGQELLRKDFSVTAFPMQFGYSLRISGRREPFDLTPDTRILWRGLNTKSMTIDWREVEPYGHSLLGLIPLKPPGWTSYYWLSPNGLSVATDAATGFVVCPPPSRLVRYITQTPIWQYWKGSGLPGRMLGPLHAARLPNGNYLIGGIGRVVELGADGWPVWFFSFEENARRARPCFNRARLGFDAPRTRFEHTDNPADWLQALHSKKAAARRHCVDAIRQFDLQTVEAASPWLKPLLTDPDEAVRDAARRTLGRLSSDVPAAWLRAIRDKDPRVRQDAGKFLTEPYSPAKMVETRLALLEDGDPGIRFQGANWSGEEFTPSNAEKIMVALVTALRDDPDADVRRAAAFSLGHFGVKARDAIPALIAGLKDPNPNLRYSCATALGTIDPRDHRVLPALMEAAQAKEPNGNAVSALIQSGQGKEILPALLERLEAKDFKGTQRELDSFRGRIVDDLGQIGPAAKAAVPALCAILCQRQAGLDIGDFGLRGVAAQTLGRIGPAAQAAIPFLEDAKNEKVPGIDTGLRDSAAAALVKIQED